MIRLATRGSRQALTQSRIVADALEVATGEPVELVRVETHGDRTQADQIPLHAIGGQGVFVKEVQRAVLDGRADLAVHSAKDLPSEPAAGLTIAAFTERRSPHDALIGSRLEELSTGATVATGSVRRRAQLARMRPDLRFVELRGNIETRLTKVPDGGAIVMAAAALSILDLEERIDDVLSLDDFVPAVGQGCVAIECRSDDAGTIDGVGRLDHRPTRRAVEIERSFLSELGAGCTMPVGAHVDGSTMRTFLAGGPSGRSVIDRISLSGDGGEHDQARHAAADARQRVA